jgi:DNA repair exonuclease SbcCD ATPase subunit
MRRTCAAWLAAVLAFGWTAACAAQNLEEAEATAVTPEEAAAHHAQGEVLYGDVWMPLKELFQYYQSTRTDMEQAVEQGRAKRAQLDDLNRQIYSLRADSESKERPIRAEMAKVVADKRQAEWALRAKPPTEPQYEPYPPRPSRTQHPSDTDYNDAMNSWRNESMTIRQQNDALKKEYDKKKAEYESAKAGANATIQASDAKVAECQQQLDALAKALEAAQAPILQQRQGVNDEMQALGRQARALLDRAGAMEEAMRAAPQDLLWKNGIVEWEGEFRLLDDLKALRAELQAEIDRMRTELQQAAQLAGRSFPDDWRHPQQDKVDALKALIEQAEKAAART